MYEAGAGMGKSHMCREAIKHADRMGLTHGSLCQCRRYTHASRLLHLLHLLHLLDFQLLGRLTLGLFLLFGPLLHVVLNLLASRPGQLR